MAKQSGTFIDDSRLHPRDSSGGPMGPKQYGDFGDGGKVVGGEADESNENPGAEDEFKAAPRGKGG